MSKTIPIVEERAHAILSASGSPTWLACTPSARYQEQFEDVETEFSREGTWAHSVAAHRLNEFLKQPTEYPKEKNIPGFEEFANVDSSEAIHAYVRRCIIAISQARAETPEALILCEQRLDFSDWVPEGFGTGDLVLISNRLLRVRDLKFGKGVRVDADDNTQLKLYALGAIATYRGIYDFDGVIVEIDQPRLNHLDGTEPMKVSELLAWAEAYVRPRAKLAWAGEGEFVPGEHCRWCRGKAECKARAVDLSDLVDEQFDEDDGVAEKTINRLSDAELAAIQPKLAQLIKWAKDIGAHIETQAFAGKRWPGLKIVEGRSNRKITDPNGLADVLEFEGFQRPLLFEMPMPPAMLGLTALEKVIGKKKFAELSEGFVKKPKGKPTLVAESDPRPEFMPDGNADADFDEDEED